MISGSPRILCLLMCGAWLNVVPLEAALAAVAPTRADGDVLESASGIGGDDDGDAQVLLNFLSRVRRAAAFASPPSNVNDRRGGGKGARARLASPESPDYLPLAESGSGRGARASGARHKNAGRDERWPFDLDALAKRFYGKVLSWAQASGVDASLPTEEPVGNPAHTFTTILTRALSSILPPGHVRMKISWAENFLVISSAPASDTGSTAYGPGMPFDSTLKGFKEFIGVHNRDVKSLALGIFLDQTQRSLKVYTVGPFPLDVVLYEQGQIEHDKTSVIRESSTTKRSCSRARSFAIDGSADALSPFDRRPGSRYLLIAPTELIPFILSFPKPLPTPTTDGGQCVFVYNLFFSNLGPQDDTPCQVAVIRIDSTLLPSDASCSSPKGVGIVEKDDDGGISTSAQDPVVAAPLPRGQLRPAKPQKPTTDLRFNTHQSFSYFSHYVAFGASFRKHSIQYLRAQHGVIATAHALLFVEASADDPLTKSQLRHLATHSVFDTDQAFSRAVEGRPALGIFCDPDSPRLIIRTVGRPPVTAIVYTERRSSVPSRSGMMRACPSSLDGHPKPDSMTIVPLDLLPHGELERAQRCVIVILPKASPKALDFCFELPNNCKSLRQKMEQLLKGLGPQSYLYAALTEWGTGQRAAALPATPSIPRAQEQNQKEGKREEEEEEQEEEEGQGEESIQ